MTDSLHHLLASPGLSKLFDALARDGDEAWLVGGCVRNALLSERNGDLDLATQALPETVMQRAQEAGLKAVPTGIDHGTITVVVDHVPFEVTSLRKDIETDGRRAVVSYTRDLAEDAARRDFTMNALYLDRQGTLHDPVNGLSDLEARRVRFIGDADERIREDYLRALRYFRFYGWYGKGSPDRDAIRAIVSNKAGLQGLSAERVWAELKKTLHAPHVTRSLLWMRQTSVYSIVLPESGDMDVFARFMRLEAATGVHPDPLLRLLVLLPLDNRSRIEALADRLRLSGIERQRLLRAQETFAAWDGIVPNDPRALRASLYAADERSVRDAMMLTTAHALDPDPELELPGDVADQMASMWNLAYTWRKPELPVSGKDLLERGIPAGPQLGAALQMMEGAWVNSDFSMGREDLLAVLKDADGRTDLPGR